MLPSPSKESPAASPPAAPRLQKRRAASGEPSSGLRVHGRGSPDEEEDPPPSASAAAIENESRSEAEGKIIKRFCERLLARSHEWEEHERAQLAVLMQEELNLSEKRFIKLLLKGDATSPSVIASLGDAGIHFSPETTMYIVAKNLRREASGAKMILRVEEAFEQGLMSVTNEDHLKLVSLWNDFAIAFDSALKFRPLCSPLQVYSYCFSSLASEELRRLAVSLIGFCRTTSDCGRVLNVFTEHIPDDATANFVQSIMRTELFLDLKGSVEDLLAEMPAKAHTIGAVVRSSFRLNQRGEVIESDADEEGNLKCVFKLFARHSFMISQ